MTGYEIPPEDMFQEYEEWKEDKKRRKIKERKQLTLLEIYEGISRYIIGQEQAKRQISVALYQHQLRINCPKTEREKMPKANIIMCGPTGSGKTEIMRVAAKVIGLPLVIRDTTQFTGPGYRGEDIEAGLSELYEKAGKDLELAQSGIIFFDEFDKIAIRNENNNINGYNTLIQQSCLKLIEGKIAYAPTNSIEKRNGTMKFDTSDLLFVAGGAHVGIRKPRIETSIGFCEKMTKEALYKPLIPQDFIDYGYLPELIGRLPVIIELDELTTTELVSVLIDTPNSLVSQYSLLFQKAGIDLTFQEDALMAIAEKAKQLHIGARGLSTIIRTLSDKLMFEICYEHNLENIIITKDYIDKSLIL